MDKNKKISMKDELNETSAIKLVKKSAFREDAFDSVDPKAKAVISAAGADQILTLTITRTRNSPLKVAEARIFDKEVFEQILSSKKYYNK